MLVDLDNGGIEDDEVYLFAAQGQVGMTAAWIWQTLIPAKKYAVGTISPPEIDGGLNFSTSLMYGTIVNTEIDQVWLEGIAIDGSMTIISEGEICDGGVCNMAQFEVDLDLVAIKAELNLEP
jgi:hypothetical protein